MKFSIHETTPTTCEVQVVSINNSTAIPLPISAEAVRGALEALLMEPEKDYLESGSVQFARHPDAIVISDKVGSVSIHWRYLYWLVQRPWG